MAPNRCSSCICLFVGGYLDGKGKIGVLLQPAELLIILGAAIGTVSNSESYHILKKLSLD